MLFGSQYEAPEENMLVLWVEEFLKNRMLHKKVIYVPNEVSWWDHISNTPSKQPVPTSKGHIPPRKNTTGSNEVGERTDGP